MKMFYRKALMKAGFDQNSKMYKDIDKIFDWEKKRLKREREQRRRAGITFVPIFSMVDEDNNPMEIPSPEDFVNDLEHEEDLKLMRKCLDQLPDRDKEILLRVYGSERGELAKIAKEWGVTYSCVYYHLQTLLEMLREMMENGGEIPEGWDDD